MGVFERRVTGAEICRVLGWKAKRATAINAYLDRLPAARRPKKPGKKSERKRRELWDQAVADIQRTYDRKGWTQPSKVEVSATPSAPSAASSPEPAAMVWAIVAWMLILGVLWAVWSSGVSLIGCFKNSLVLAPEGQRE